AILPRRPDPGPRVLHLPLRHQAAGAVERDPALHDRGVAGDAHLRVGGLRLVAELRTADPLDADGPEPARPALRAHGRDPAAARLLRLHAGGRASAGAAGAASGPPGATGHHSVPRQAD